MERFCDKLEKVRYFIEPGLSRINKLKLLFIFFKTLYEKIRWVKARRKWGKNICLSCIKTVIYCMSLTNIIPVILKHIRPYIPNSGLYMITRGLHIHVNCSLLDYTRFISL